jgi:tetratricopeptide (TPR) repeat protein
MMFCCCSFLLKAQESLLLRDGNKLYEEGKYKDAASAYQQALLKNPTSLPGMFNLGNSLYQQQQFDAARQVMSATAKNAKDKNDKAHANYNIGNTYMAEKKWEDAIESYKQTLRNNPQDADAKYNLSYAREMLKKQQGGGGKDNKDKDQDKKDQKQQQQSKDNKDNKDQQNKQQQPNPNDKQDKKDPQQQPNPSDKQDNKDDKQQPQGQPSKLSQQQADQLLNALQQEEKKLQEKKQKEKGVPVKMGKDW